MKKNYVAPECAVYALPLRPMCQQQSVQVSSRSVSSSSRIGFSNSFSGGVEEDDGPLNLWEEEKK